MNHHPQPITYNHTLTIRAAKYRMGFKTKLAVKAHSSIKFIYGYVDGNAIWIHSGRVILISGEILWLKLIVRRAIVKKYDELRVFVGYLSDTRSERPIQHIIDNNT